MSWYIVRSGLPGKLAVCPVPDGVTASFPRATPDCSSELGQVEIPLGTPRGSQVLFLKDRSDRNVERCFLRWQCVVWDEVSFN